MAYPYDNQYTFGQPQPYQSSLITPVNTSSPIGTTEALAMGVPQTNTQPQYGFQTTQVNAVPNLNFNQPQNNLFANQTPGLSYADPTVAASAPETTSSLFGGVSSTDWLNFGSGLISAGLGAYYQNQALDQSQQALDLSRDKYNNYLNEQERMREADQRRTEQAGRTYDAPDPQVGYPSQPYV